MPLGVMRGRGMGRALNDVVGNGGPSVRRCGMIAEEGYLQGRQGGLM